MRDEVAKEQNTTPALVAGSIGNYTCCIPEGSPYHIRHNETTDEEEYYSFHKDRFETFADHTDVDILAVETQNCMKEINVLLDLLPTRPGAKAMFAMNCLDATDLASGEDLEECI